MALWLPLQGVAAIAMPYCAGMAGADGATAAATGGDPRSHAGHDAAAGRADHEGHAGHDAQAAGDPPPAKAGTSCDRCGLCLMACAYPLPAPAGLSTFEMATVLVASVEPHAAVNHPELFQIPPLALRA